MNPIDPHRTLAVARKEVRHILRDPFTQKPYVGIYATKRAGGDVADFDAIKLAYFGS